MDKETSNKNLKTTLDNICQRGLYYINQMIHLANHRDDIEKGDPKIGGHPAACASSLHILGALHLLVRTGFDHLAIKPHGSPTDHSFNFMLELLLDKNNERLADELAKKAMHELRAFPIRSEYVFQSYHSKYDPDCHNYLPSGTVGIPPVHLGYLALAYRYAQDQGWEVPANAHFWAVIGDSEFREGSLYEAMPDFAERELGNVTWIVDYNRQSLDGHRITNRKIMNGNDDRRLERTFAANGWQVIQVRHGQARKALFEKPGGEVFQKFLEEDLSDYEFQALLLIKEAEELKKHLLGEHQQLAEFLSPLSEKMIYEAVHDLGGHDLFALAEAMEESKTNPRQPTLIVAHTIKGWGLPNAAEQSNHSSLLSKKEIKMLQEGQGIADDDLFARFSQDSDESQFLRERGTELFNEIKEQDAIRDRNWEKAQTFQNKVGEIPQSLDVNFKMASYPHTQWMLGQMTAKLSRIGQTPLDEKELAEKQKALSDEEKGWKLAGESFVAMAPDVGTSTNLNPTMDGKIFGVGADKDYESQFGVKESKVPDLVPHEDTKHRYFRFEIAEANAISCLGSVGQMRDLLGIPLLPLMTVYDFFVKRALDQHFYNLYWRSSFILVGTPSGVTLSPEGAQHGWKSDIQIPHQITWEPAFCQEFDWILADAIRRHMQRDNEGRSGVHIRAVTRGVDQKLFLKHLKRQARFKSNLGDQTLKVAGTQVEGTEENQVATVDEATILETVRTEVLKGGYFLIDYRGYTGYEPGDNVVHILAMGTMVTEAIKASETLLQRGIYANVLVVSSPDLIAGNLAHEKNYHYLKNELGVSGELCLQPLPNGNAQAADIVTLSGRRVPLVSVHDGEAGIIDNVGSTIGTRQESLAVRKHSRCGRPTDIYAYHKIDDQAIVEAVGKVLAESAMESVKISRRVLEEASQHSSQFQSWQELWPEPIEGENKES